MELLLDGEAEALTRRVVELALAGDAMPLRLCLERVIPPRRGSPVQLGLTPIRGAADLGGNGGHYQCGHRWRDHPPADG